LFCLYLWDPPNWDAWDHILGVFGQLLTRRGAWAWFHGVWTCGAKVLEYWMISSLKIKLNCTWKFQRTWNVALVLLERSWCAGFNGIYLVTFGFRIWEILILRWFLPLKIQINSKKPGFWKENAVEDMVTVGPNGTDHTSNNYVWIKVTKKNTSSWNEESESICVRDNKWKTNKMKEHLLEGMLQEITLYIFY
jgi:hypothetical protein